MTDGENKSAADRLQIYEKTLNEYSTNCGLSEIRFNKEVEKALSLTRDQILGLTTEDCAIYKFQLEQYSAFLQRELNRQNNRVAWAERELSLLIAAEAPKYGSPEEVKYIKYELLRSKIIGANSGARALSEIIKHANGRATELQDLPSKVSLIAYSISEIKKLKENKK